MKNAIKKIYKILPFKKQIFDLLKFFWTPPYNTYKHLTFNGFFKVKTNCNTSFFMNHFGYELENFVYWEGLYGTWEKTSLEIWTELSKTSSSIMDIGANSGIYSLVSSSVNPDAKIYAVEPIERVFKRLTDNISFNGFNNIKTYNVGLSNIDGKAIVYDSYEAHTYSVTINKNLWSKERKVKEVEIPIRKIDSIIQSDNIDGVDLMKIDVETHEFEVLQGMSDYLFKYKPTMLIEILNDEIGENIESLIKPCGYLYFNIDEKSKPKKVNSLCKSAFHNFLICNEKIAKQLNLI